jgi:hypothetical protein
MAANVSAKLALRSELSSADILPSLAQARIKNMHPRVPGAYIIRNLAQHSDTKALASWTYQKKPPQQSQPANTFQRAHACLYLALPGLRIR